MPEGSDFTLQATISERVNTKICETGRKNSFPMLHILIIVLHQYILFIYFSLVFTTEEI